MNQLLGQKLAVVTPKPQTTRNRILGVKNREGAQIVYIDTPGVHKAKSSLNQYMVEQALNAVGDCDVVLFLVEAPRGGGFEVGEGNRLILDKLASLKRPRILAVNKVDLVADKYQLLPVLDGWSKELPFDAIVPICATTGDGTDRLEQEIAARLPQGDALFPEETLTDSPERFLAAELIREQTFHLLEQELPYSIAVTVENWKERADKNDVVIDANIHVERDSQKRIVVGENGKMIKEIGVRARKEISALLQCPVHLKLFVKVDPEWTRTQAAIRRMGYE
jgi:GTP-binding protein Era